MPAKAGKLATLIRDYALGTAEPCRRLADGTGVWVRLGDASAAGTLDYCPSRDPPLHGP